MAWVTISLRKMALNARIANMEYRLMKLSQDKMSQQMAAGYAQSAMNVQKNNAYFSFDDAYNNTIQGMNPDDKNYTKNVQQAGLDLQRRKMALESIFQAQESSMLEANNRKEQQIDQEIQVLEAQIKAARAEEEQLEKAMDEDIKKTAIKLM